MFQSQYSNDVSVFATDGRILQLEYAQNASKYGQTVLGIKSQNQSVLISLFSDKEPFTPRKNKIFSLSKNVGAAITGIIGDGKTICQFLERKDEQYRHSYKVNCPIASLVLSCSSLFNRNTFHSGARPYGATILINGLDSNGPSLYEISTERLSLETSGTAIGSGSQTVKARLVGKLKKLKEFSLDELINLSIEISGKEENVKNFGKSRKETFQASFNGKGLGSCILNSKCKIYILSNFRRRKN